VSFSDSKQERGIESGVNIVCNLAVIKNILSINLDISTMFGFIFGNNSIIWTFNYNCLFVVSSENGI